MYFVLISFEIKVDVQMFIRNFNENKLLFLTKIYFAFK